MAAEVVKIVDPDNGAGTDYTSLSAWEAGEAADLVTADEIAVAKCRCTGGTADTTTVTASASWVTDATRYVKIWTDPTEAYRHNGTYQTGNKYRLETSQHTFISDNIDYLYLIGIQFQLTNSAFSWRHSIRHDSTSGAFYVKKCLFKGVFTGASAAMIGIRVQGNGGAFHLSNSVFYDYVRAAVDNFQAVSIYGSGQYAYLYNNTVHNCFMGFRDQGVTTVTTIKNCLAQDCGSFCFSGNWNTASHNCSDDGTEPGTSGQNGEVIFADEGANDFHLDSTDTVARGNGTDLSGTFTDDIDDDTRSAWDIGADEYVAAGVTHEGNATVLGKGLLGAIAAGLNLASAVSTVVAAGKLGVIAAGLILATATATITGCGLLGTTAPNVEFSGDSTITGSGLLGDVAAGLDLASAEATVTGHGLVPTTYGGLDPAHGLFNFFSADWEDTEDLGQIYGTFAVSTDRAKTGTHSYKAVADGVNAAKFYAVDTDGGMAALNEHLVTCGFHFSCSALPTGAHDPIAITLPTGAGPQDSFLYLETDGKLQVVDAGGNPIGTSTTALVANKWYHVEVQVFSDPADYENGFHVVAINGSVEISGVGVAGQSLADCFVLGCCANNSSNSPSYYFDNVTLSGDLVGECQVSVLRVMGDGADTDWDNGDYQKLDELPPDDATSYVDTTTQDAEQSVEVRSASAEGIWPNCTFLGAKTMVRAGRAGTGSTGKAYIKDGATRYYTYDSFTFPSSWTTYCKLYEKALTRAEVDALEPGVIQLAAAPANAARCSALGLQVLWSGGASLTRVFYNFGG